MFNRNKFIVKKVIKKDDLITFEYDVSGEFKKYFWMGEMFNIQYEGINIESVPDSIAIIPLVANILPMIWTNNAVLYIDEIDEDFYKCIKIIKNSYKEMLPMLKFKGKIKVKKVVKNEKITTDKTLCFFTGGVDSYSTYINNKDTNPDMVTVWGADIDWENVDGFNNVRKYINKIAKIEKCNNIFVHASVRRFIDNSQLEDNYFKIINDNWWNAMQHGMGIISLAAPLSYVNGYSKVFFASTYTQEEIDTKKIICASVPQIDNNITFAGVKVIHDGVEYSRMDKTINICNYAKKTKKDTILHVCYRSKAGDNCCKCEKCYRTMSALLSEGEDPSRYGFKYDDTIKKEMEEYMMNHDMPERTKMLWIEIAKNLNSKKRLNEYQKYVMFVKELDCVKEKLDK